MDMSGMNGMDMNGMAGMDMAGMDMGSKDKNDKGMAGMDMAGMASSDKNKEKSGTGMDMSSMPGMSMDSKDKNGMDMATTPSMTGMSMPGSTAAAAAMTGMDMSGGSMSMSMSGMDMTMVFHANTHTPLYTRAWTPDTAAAYAGTCLFLVGLSVLARCLLAFRSVQQSRWRRRGRRGRSNRPSSPSASRGKNDFVVVDEELLPEAEDGPQPWRLSVDPPRAVLDTVVVAVGYMIMLAVMTMNVGYFFSVLAGVLVGSLAVGRFGSATEH